MPDRQSLRVCRSVLPTAPAQDWLGNPTIKFGDPWHWQVSRSDEPMALTFEHYAGQSAAGEGTGVDIDSI